MKYMQIFAQIFIQLIQGNVIRIQLIQGISTVIQWDNLFKDVTVRLICCKVM